VDRYSLVLLEARAGVAVAHRRLGPSSSATTSTSDRALPSSAVQVRCWSRPTTTTRLPLDSEVAACSAWSRHTTTVKNDGSCSRRPDTSVRFVRRLVFERRIAYVKLGRHVRIPAGDLAAFIAAGRVEIGELPTLTRRGA
jgi:excisionase family DNA binding protein